MVWPYRGWSLMTWQNNGLMTWHAIPSMGGSESRCGKRTMMTTTMKMTMKRRSLQREGRKRGPERQTTVFLSVTQCAQMATGIEADRLRWLASYLALRR